MIYEIKKDNQTYQVDDLTVFSKQPKAFRDAFDNIAQGDIAHFDNATVMILETGRVIVTEKVEDNE